MAEYSSLYIKIEIKEEKLKQFFEEKPVPDILNEASQSLQAVFETYNKRFRD